MSSMATLVTCHGVDTSGVTLGPCLVISSIGKNKADSFPPHIKPTYRTRRSVFRIYMQIMRLDAFGIVRRRYRSKKQNSYKQLNLKVRLKPHYRKSKFSFSLLKILPSHTVDNIHFINAISHHRIRGQHENDWSNCDPPKGSFSLVPVPTRETLKNIRILVLPNTRARVFLSTWQIQNTSRSELSLSFFYIGPLVPLSSHAPKEIQEKIKTDL